MAFVTVPSEKGVVMGVSSIYAEVEVSSDEVCALGIARCVVEAAEKVALIAVVLEPGLFVRHLDLHESQESSSAITSS